MTSNCSLLTNHLQTIIHSRRVMAVLQSNDLGSSATEHTFRHCLKEAEQNEGQSESVCIY